MAITRRAGSAAIVMCACVLTLTFACSSSSSEPAATGQPAAQSQTPGAANPAPRRQNACDLFDIADVEQIAGTKLGRLHNIEDEDQTTCEVHDDATKQVVMYVTVFWKGGKEKARAEQAGLSMAKQMLNTKDVDIEELTGSGKVRGLADKAFYSDVMPSWVLKGDVLVQIISPTWEHARTAKAFTTVAKQALARLPEVG